MPSLLDCQTAFQTIAKECVHLIQSGRKSAIAADPEAIHAMRIELTRLRAAVLGDVCSDILVIRHLGRSIVECLNAVAMWLRSR